MRFRLLTASLLAAALTVPVAAHAQGVPGGVAHGFNEGGRIAGPVGAIVGGAVGGVVGGIEGVLGIPPGYQRAEYQEPPPRRSYRHHRKVRHIRRHD